jgi:hypothetical protein
MSLSKEARQRDALQLMLQRLGDRRISACFFDTTKPPFNAIQQTTWAELQQGSYLKANLKRYRLTAAGWLRALQESGLLQDPVFKQDVGKLVQSVKTNVKDRQRGTLMTVETIARDSGLSENWIYNAIESNVIEKQFGRTGATWAHGFVEGTMIHLYYQW